MLRDQAYLLDIMNEARLALSFAKGIDREAFESDLMRQRAVVRSIEIIGEAARRVSVDYREQHPELPWFEMIGMRNRLIHEYDAIDLGIVWHVLCDELPALIELIEGQIPPE